MQETMKRETRKAYLIPIGSDSKLGTVVLARPAFNKP